MQSSRIRKALEMMDAAATREDAPQTRRHPYVGLPLAGLQLRSPVPWKEHILPVFQALRDSSSTSLSLPQGPGCPESSLRTHRRACVGRSPTCDTALFGKKQSDESSL